ncbi:E3 SUMO-protein ligase PIAS2-like isoform X3 [Diabrotica virgifera virgifera]|uniref:E3 SUMO-protein ligase PIAS2 n=1 Tax=Diabrotica virgifera virgifera TaxID=50390 RepID=A0ABM5KZ70_DIAVI|nr:E3 SUMO-protein ligase PIAS2-like isoform X3 [Diabrotica virgifera virgifera]
MSDNTAEYRTMLAAFRVSEFHQLLGFAGRSKAGRKTELQKRALDLLKIRSPPILVKITELYKKIQQEISNGSSGTPVSSMPQQDNDQTIVQSHSVGGRQMSSAAQPTMSMYQTNMYSHYPEYSQNKQQPNVAYPIHPDVKFRKLPFYDVLAEILKPSTLVPSNNQRLQEAQFRFSLSPQQSSDIANSRDTRPGTTCDYIKQVQLRFCLLETSCEQQDAFPPCISVRVNNKICPLPNPIPTNKPGVEPKRPPRPVNITAMVKLSPTIGNHLSISWATDLTRGYALSVSLVQKLSSVELLQRLKSRGSKNAEYTRSLIKEKLNDDGDEIATTSLRVSLMCPLGKLRMTTPCRPITCMHLQCFDAYLFLQMNEKKPTWNCPVCDKPALYDDLRIDGYFTEVLNSPLLASNCNEIQLNKDGTWCVQTNEKLTAKLDQTTVINIDDSQEVIYDVSDVEIIPISSDSTDADPTNSSTTKLESTVKPEESRKRDIVDLTCSSSEDEEPAPKVRAISPKPDSASISSSSNQSRPITTIDLFSVSSLSYPLSPVIINLDSPSPPCSPPPTPRPQPVTEQIDVSSMIATQADGNTTPSRATTPLDSSNNASIQVLENDTSQNLTDISTALLLLQ